MPDDIQSRCTEGQDRLLATDYLGAEDVLVQAEAIALAAKDWDSLSRLYMPLQEARRQRRQRAGEGIIKLDAVAHSAAETVDPAALLEKYPHGQLIVAGFGTIAPAVELRKRAHERRLFLDVFLGATYWLNGAVAVAIVPNDRVALPPEGEYSPDALIHKLPPHSLLIPLHDLPSGERPGDTATFAQTMALWERLHLPFLSLADSATNLERKIAGYRETISVDYACELAHQKLSGVARELERSARAARTPGKAPA
jgi:hypothetical protein